MTNQNSYIVQQAEALESPIAFTPTDAAAGDDGTETAITAIVRANIDLLLALVAREGSDESDQRLFLDQMTPAARTSLYAILLALKAATNNA